MPTSNPDKIGAIVRLVQKLKPNSILDIGIGFGKWGHLFREYLDIFGSIIWEKKDWKTRIDGIEIFEPYINDGTKYYYNTIFIGKAEEIIKTVPNYDLIFISDVLEHISKDHALNLIKTIISKCKYFILNIPLGDNWIHRTDSINKSEAHISAWTQKELESLCKIEKIIIYPSGKKEIGMFLIKGNCNE